MIFILEDNDDRIAYFKKAIGEISHHIEKTVPEAIEWLSQHSNKVRLYSLDNDLILPEYEGDEGEGWQLCEWILDNANKTPIICHTTNRFARGKMEIACADAGWQLIIVPPFNDVEWIETDWIKAINENYC